MRKYVDKKGGLEVQKAESVAPSHAKMQSNEPKEIQAADIIDTAISYQVPSVGVSSNENGGSECKVCGAKTSYDNRHFCVDCWKKYKDEMIAGIKENVHDVEIHID